MPELIAGILAIILAAYALVYALTIALYGLLSALPICFVGGLTALGVAHAAADRVPTRCSWLVDMTTSPPTFQLASSKDGLDGATLTGQIAGLATGGIATYFLTNYVLTASGTDAQWMRIAGLILGGAIGFFFITIGIRSKLLSSLTSKAVQVPCEVQAAAFRYSNGIDKVNDLTNILGLQVNKEWAEIQAFAATIKSPDPINFLVEHMEKLSDESDIYARNIQALLDASSKIKRAAIDGTELAMKAGSRTVFGMIDDLAKLGDMKAVAAALRSQPLQDVLSATVNSIKGLTEICENLRSTPPEPSKYSPPSGQNEQVIEVRTLSDAFKLLGIPTDSPRPVIVERLRRMIQYFHPDKATTLLETEQRQYGLMAMRINQARQILESNNKL